MKRCSVLAAGLALCLALTGCGGGGVTSFDATAYMQGLLDETYLGKFSEDYMKMVGIDEDEARKTYEEGLEAEYENYFADFFAFDREYVSDETRQAAIDLLAEVYQHSKYEVKPGSKVEGGYVVEIIVEPVDMIALIDDQYIEDYSDTFNAKYEDVTQEKVDAMSDAEYDEFMTGYENDWANGIIDLFHEHMDELGYTDAQSIMVQFKPDDDGYYTISDNDFANLDNLILAYSY